MDLSRSSLGKGELLRLNVSGVSMLPHLRDGDGLWIERSYNAILKNGHAAGLKNVQARAPRWTGHLCGLSRWGFWFLHALRSGWYNMPGGKPFMLNLDSYPVRDSLVAGKVIASDLPGKTEAVLVLPTQGKVKVLNEVGARIWSLVDGSRQVRQIVEIICAEYQVEREQAEADILNFLAELKEKSAVLILDHPGV